MSDKALTISYFGRLKKVEKIFFSFSYGADEYAFVAFDKEYKDLHILKTKFSMFRGVYVDCYVNTEAVVIGEAIFNNISGVPGFMNGEHYTVNKVKGEYDIRPGNRLRRFSPGTVFIASLLSLVYSFAVAALGVSLYFRKPGDWIIFMTKSYSNYELAAVCLALCCAFIIAVSAYRRKKAKGSVGGVGEAVIASAFTVLAFGLIARPSVRIAAAAVIAAVAAGFAYRIFRIRKMRPKRSRVHALDRLIKKTKTAGVFAGAALVIFSAVIGIASPYARNRQNSQADCRRIEQRFDSACDNLKEEVWETLSERQKIKTLQSIVDREALENKSFSAKVCAAELNRSFIFNGVTRASYYNGYNTIFMDRDLALNAGPCDCVLFLLHEYRHCYQEWFSTDKSNSGNELAQRFSDNFENYSSAKTDGSEAYESQLLEIDGNYFAYNRMEYYSKFFSKEDFENSEYYQKKDNIRFILKSFKSGNGWDYAVSHPYENGDDTSGDFITLCAYTGPGDIATLEIPEKFDGLPVRSLSDGLVRYIPRIEKVLIPATVDEISSDIFTKCEELTVEISPDNRCFRMVDGVMLFSSKDNTIVWVDRKAAGKVTIPKETKSVLWDAFAGCKGITDIDVEPGNGKYRSENGLLFNRITDAMVLCPEGKSGVVRVPECSLIRTEAFSNCGNITEIIIPDTCKKIESRAFSGCDSLLRLDIPPTVEEISSFAFDGLMYLERLSLPSSVSFSRAGEKTDYLRLHTPSLKDIYFDGTKAEWEALNVTFDDYYIFPLERSKSLIVHCTDGNINKR